MISARDVALYRDNGYLVVEEVLDRATLAAVRSAVAGILDGAHGIAAHTPVYDLEPSHRPEAPRVRRIKTPHAHFPFFSELARYPRMLEILQALLGPGVRLHGSKINMKAPRYGSPVEWHQDWAFYPHTNDDLLAVGVMLDDCTVENGAMLVLPGSHKGPTHDHHADGYFCGAIDPARVQLDWDAAVPVTGRAGGMSFHHVRMVHGSAQNLSEKPRALLLYEFAAADAWPLMGVPDLAAFDARIVAGSPTIEPRLAPAPVRMPLPPAPRQGSIYENQTTARNRFFAFEKEGAFV
jgi:phytanoyl-CoA hydroxylase